jgi:hypothetical protein
MLKYTHRSCYIIGSISICYDYLIHCFLLLIKNKHISWCISSISYRGFLLSHHLQSSRDINCSFHNNFDINSWVYSIFQNIEGKTLQLCCFGNIWTYSNACCIIQFIRNSKFKICYNGFFHRLGIRHLASRRNSSIYSRYNSIMLSFSKLWLTPKW